MLDLMTLNIATNVTFKAKGTFKVKVTCYDCEPWEYVTPVVAALVVVALVRRATHLLNCGIVRPVSKLYP